MKKKFLQYLFLSCALMALFSSCRKDSFKGTETGNSGKTFVWITEAQETSHFFLPFTNTISVTMFTIRRDAANNGDLQKDVTVTLTAIDMTTKSFTDKFGSYTPVPSSLATQATASGITTSASAITVHFAPGEYFKNYILNVNGSNFDPSNKYAIAYAITNHGGFVGKHLSDGTSADTIVSVLGVQNQYAGVYAATGTFTRYSAPGVPLDSRAINQDKTLGTVDANTVSSTAADLGEPITLRINADNTVTVTFVGQSLTDLPGPFTQVGDNFYDPSLKKFTLHYQYRGGLRTTEEFLTLKQ